MSKYGNGAPQKNIEFYKGPKIVIFGQSSISFICLAIVVVAIEVTRTKAGFHFIIFLDSFFVWMANWGNFIN